MMYKLAYYIRMLDPDNIYTRKIFTGRVYPLILIDIFESNVWNPDTETMLPDVSKQFKLHISSNYLLQYSKSSKSSANTVISPFVAKNDSKNNKAY